MSRHHQKIEFAISHLRSGIKNAYKNLQRPKYIHYKSLGLLIVKVRERNYNMQYKTYGSYYCRSGVRVRNFNVIPNQGVILLPEVPQAQYAAEQAKNLFRSIQPNLSKSSKKVKNSFTLLGCELALAKYCTFTNNCKNLEFITKDIYSLICDPHFLLFTVFHIKAQAVSLGISSIFIENITLTGILKIAIDLKTHKFSANPIRRLTAPKSGGGAHLIGIASSRDSLVQHAVDLLLTPYFSRYFLPCSHGFREGFSTHTCLAAMSKN